MTHKATIESLPVTESYLVVCSCGFRGDGTYEMGLATADLKDHLTSSFQDGDITDCLCCGAPIQLDSEFGGWYRIDQDATWSNHDLIQCTESDENEDGENVHHPAS